MKRAANHPELLDGPLDPQILAGNLRDLTRVNRWLGGTRLSTQAVGPFVLGAGAGAWLTLLDVGTGAADIPIALSRSIRNLTITATDVRPEIVDYAGRKSAGRQQVTVRLGTLEDEPDGSYDVVHASLLLHHLEPSAAKALLSQMHRVARVAIVVNDLDRGWLWFVGAWLLTRLFTRNLYTRNDAALSVRRAYRPGEVVAMARSAGLRPVARYGAFPSYRYALVFIRDMSGRG